ncbi:MAG: glycosyltransferase family 2 protein [Abditibacteriaceae bacterium]
MISVIILHHSKARYSEACLVSLLQTTTRPLQVINVDNGSTDDTAKVLLEWEKNARAQGIEVLTLPQTENIGAVRGRNVAMENSTGDYIVFLDNDTLIFQPEWLDELQLFLETHPKCGIVVPKLLFPWEPFAIECCGCALSPQGRVAYLGRSEERNSITQSQQIQAAISAAWMMPRAVYDKLGGLDEIYSPVQYEDLDYCYRARAASFEVWANPAVELFHFEHTTTAGSDDVNFQYVTSRNALTFKKRWKSTFEGEVGMESASYTWRQLPKSGVEDVNWEKLVRGT